MIANRRWMKAIIMRFCFMIQNWSTIVRDERNQYREKLSSACLGTPIFVIFPEETQLTVKDLLPGYCYTLLEGETGISLYS